MPKLDAMLRLVVVTIVVSLAAGCSTQARRVDCDGRLRPINVPAPVTAPPPATTTNGQTP